MKGLAFHCHHYELVEYVHDYDERVKFIKENKPKGEQELRLRLFKMIPEELIPGKDSKEYDAYRKAGDAYVKARDAYRKARDAYYKVWVAYDKAWDAFDKAWDAYQKKYRKELEKLHSKLCPDCPFDGHTIFTRKNEDGNWY